MNTTKNDNSTRNFSFLLNLILLLVLAYLWFFKISKEPSRDIANTCTPCLETKNYEPLSADYVTKLISDYRNHHWSTINSNYISSTFGDDKMDSRSVWFDLNTLKSFINTIEVKTSATCGDHCAKHLGLRMYFGEYDASNAPLPEYVGLHTLLMVPTMRNPDATALNTPSENVDFDPSHLAKCTPVAYDSSWQKIMVLAPTSLDMMNHGTLIPPPDLIHCTGATLMHYIDVQDGLPACLP
jgi:hypothetical protein